MSKFLLKLRYNAILSDNGGAFIQTKRVQNGKKEKTKIDLICSKEMIDEGSEGYWPQCGQGVYADA